MLERIKPSSAEGKKREKVIASFLSKLNKQLGKATAIVGGSGAKGTWLQKGYDTDIFVLYEYQNHASRSEELSNLLEPRLKKAFKGVKIIRLHGSRDYFQLTYQKLRFEVVPILKIGKAEQAKNITDISPLHALWVNKHTNKLKDDIMLTKQLCKAQGFYGAESYIQGFSGYVVEVLIAHYGSLEKLLQAARRWKVKEVVDHSGFYTKDDALFHLNKSKQLSPLIVIDPVDKSRNAAAALSMEKFLAFQKVAAAVLKSADERLFEKKKLSYEKLAKEKGNLVFIEALPLKGKEDVVGTRLLKVYQFLLKSLQPFEVDKSGWEWEKKAVFYFVLRTKQLPAEEIRMGPPLQLVEFVADFKKKHKNWFVEEGRIKARVVTPRPLLKEFVWHIVKEDYVKTKIEKISKAIVAT